MANRDYGCDSHRRADTEDACAARQPASRCLQGPSARAASQDIAGAEACRLEHESESAWPGPQDLPSLRFPEPVATARLSGDAVCFELWAG